MQNVHQMRPFPGFEEETPPPLLPWWRPRNDNALCRQRMCSRGSQRVTDTSSGFNELATVPHVPATSSAHYNQSRKESQKLHQPCRWRSNGQPWRLVDRKTRQIFYRPTSPMNGRHTRRRRPAHRKFRPHSTQTLLFTKGKKKEGPLLKKFH